MRTLALVALLLLIVTPSKAAAQSLFNGPENANYDHDNDRWMISNWISGSVTA